MVDLATAKHGRTIFTYICPETGKEFDVLGSLDDIPMAKIISERFEVGQAFCTKLWNAARFALMNLGQHEYKPLELDSLHTEDRWILSRLSKVISRVTQNLKEYNPSAAIGTAREFFWGELCDWYLEFIKPRFKDESSAPTARTVLSLAVDLVLRLFHPFVPYITEVLWERLNSQSPVRGLKQPLPSHELLISAEWPEPQKIWESDKIESEFEIIQKVIRAIRDLRSRYNVPPSRKLNVLVKVKNAAADMIKRLDYLILHMANLSALNIGPDVERPATAAVQVLENMEIYLDGVIDPEKETLRLRRNRKKLLEDIEKARQRLDNDQFISRAPAKVVDAEKKKLEELKSQIAGTDKNLEDLKNQK
jgi:valyl-tRNA synthetase